MMNEISNFNLSENDLPPQNAEWSALVPFALTFNGYNYWGSLTKCAEVSNRYAEQYREKHLLPESLTELRTCLFFEQRGCRHSGYDPSAETMAYLHAIVEAIRVRVRTKQLD